MPTSSENRPKNLNVVWIIKAYHSVSNPELLQAENIINKINDVNKEIQTLKTQGGGRKNLIINGDFRVHQRGTDATWDITDEANFPRKEFGVADRFRSLSCDPGTSTEARLRQYIEIIDNRNWLTSKVEVPFNSEDYYHRATLYYFEAKDILFLANKKVTISFLFRASKLGQYSITFQLVYALFVTLFSWEYKGGIKKCTFTFTLPSDLLKSDVSQDHGFSIQFNLMVGDQLTEIISDDSNLNGIFKNCYTSSAGLMRTSDVRWDREPNNWVSYTEVQFEVGDTATDFERLTYAEQLAMCQRYYLNCPQRIHAAYNQGGEWLGEVYYPTTMRVIPSISFGAITGNPYIHGSPINHTTYGFLLYSTSRPSYIDGFTANAEL